MQEVLSKWGPRGPALPFPLLIATFCILWSSAFSVAKIAVLDCPPLLLLAARFLLAGLIMLGAAFIRTDWRNLGRRDIAALAALGVLNNALYLGLNTIGIQSISAGLSALIISANPVLTAILAAAFLSERMTWRKVLGLTLGVGGVAFIVGRRVNTGLADPVGVAFTIGALVALVTGTILFKRLSPRGELWVGNGIQNLVGGIAIAPFAFASERLADVVPGWRLLAALCYSVVLVSILGYLLWFTILKGSGATAASSYHFLMPPLGLLFGWLLLGERVQLFDVFGIVPVALGIYLVTRPPRLKTPQAHAAIAGNACLTVGDAIRCPAGK